MKGLIIKDILVLRRYSIIFICILLFYAFMGIMGGDMSFFSSAGGIFCVMLPITSFSYDNLSKWDRFAGSLPVTRRQIVLAKYLLTFSMVVIGTGLSGLLLGSQCLVSSLSVPNTGLTLLGTGGSAFMVACILLPLIYRFGVEKSRILMLIIVFIPVGIIAVFNDGILPPLSLPPLYILLFILLPFMLGVLFISYRFSLKIYQSKEF